MTGPRISYVDPAGITDAAMLAELDRCRREGTPRPESQAVRAHVPAVFWSFANSWRDVFKNGVADHAIKELCRIYVSRSVKCEFCGNQRSMKAARQGIVEDDYMDLINFESSALRTLDIEHHQVLAGTDASMAPGFETDEALQRSKADPGYWAGKPPKEAAE